MDYKNREICRRCDLNEVEAEPIDSAFRFNCNECSIYRTEEARGRWIARIESVLHSCCHCLTSFRLEKPLVPHLCQRVDVFPCGGCGKQLYSEEDLVNHLKYVHKKKSRIENEQREICGTNVMYQCKICQKKFTTHGALKTHLQIHTGERLYQCNICQNKYGRNDILDKHMLTHTVEKPWQCKTCGKTFSVASNLKVHIRTHTGEKPYQCTVCQKMFSQLPHLKAHLRIHTGEKPYQCKVCAKRFTRSSVLKTHQRTHTGEKPYQCTICQKRCAESSSLRKHLLSHIKKTLPT